MFDGIRLVQNCSVTSLVQLKLFLRATLQPGWIFRILDKFFIFSSGLKKPGFSNIFATFEIHHLSATDENSQTKKGEKKQMEDDVGKFGNQDNAKSKIPTCRMTLKTIVFAGALLCSPVQAEELVFNTQDFAPFSFHSGENVDGPAAEIITTVCKAEKLECAFRLLPWKRAQAEVRDGQANAMFVIGRNAEREEWLHFSPAIITTEYGFFVQETNPVEFSTIEDVRGYTVGVYGPSNTSRSLEAIRDKLGDLTIEMKADDESGFRKLSLGRVDAVFSNRDVGNALVARLGLKNIRYAGAQRSLNYFIGFSKAYNDVATVERFNTRLMALIADGFVDDILSAHNMVLR